MAWDLNVAQKTVWNHLKKPIYTKKFDVCVADELMRKNVMDRTAISKSLLNHNKIDSFMKLMLTGDEKP